MPIVPFDLHRLNPMALTVRYLILCDDVRTDPSNLHRLDVIGLLSNLKSRVAANKAFRRPVLTVLVILTDCTSEEGEISVRIVQEGTRRILFTSAARKVRFPADPAEVVGFTFVAKDCSFPGVGVYWVECLFDGAIIARQPLRVTV